MLNHMKKHAVQSFVAFKSPVGHPAWPTILRVAQATNAPIATEALGQIAKLYAIEADVRAQSARNSPQSLQASRGGDAALVRRAASCCSRPQHDCRSDPLRTLALDALTRFLHEGGIELDQPG